MSAIDRDVVIKKYINPDIEKFHNSDVKIVLENLKQNILKMPTIDRPQGWIPCSERLPKDWEHVLVCTTVTYTTPIFVDWYVDEVGSWANEGDSVIAWMPLPKPWKGADDESGSES